MAKQIPLTQGKFAIVDDEDYDWLSQWKWYFSHGYAKRDRHICMVGKKEKKERIYMHRLINKTGSNVTTDHINGDKLDNRKENLRCCTDAQNNMNKSIRKDSVGSKFKGVKWHKVNKNWNARLFGKHIGVFRSEIEAAIAYNRAAISQCGDFAKLNLVSQDKTYGAIHNVPDQEMTSNYHPT